MSHLPADFYLDEVMQAAYVEKDWFDHIVATRTARPKRFAFAPFDLRWLHSDFHGRFVDLIAGALGDHSPRRVLEIGASTGRTFYELARAVPSLTHATLVEPSRHLGEVFTKIFGRSVNAPSAPYLPTLRGNGELLEVRMDTTAVRAATAHVEVRWLDAPFAQVPADLGHFDLVVCANVIDQCHDPLALVDLLHRSTAPGGLVAIACTYQWQAKYRGLPTDPVRHLDELFPGPWALLGEADIPFRVRTNERHWMTFLSHACVFRRAPG